MSYERSLLDPKDLGGEQYDKLNDKLRVAKMIIARSPDKGGSPFIYAFATTKTHSLADIKCPVYVDDEGNTEYFYTAGTDGKNYGWSPQMIERLTPKELGVILCHETYHIVFQHCDSNRVFGKNKKVWNIAIDYVVNCMIEHDYRQIGRISTYTNYRDGNHPIWQGGVGKPLYFDELLKSIEEETKALKNMRKGKAPKTNKNSKPQQQKPFSYDDIRIYADYSLYGKGAEEIYDTIMEKLKDMENEMVEMILGALGGQTMDEHSETEIPRPQLLQEILDAVTATKQLCGTVPASVSDQLLSLQEPKLSWQDIVRNALQAKRQEKGMINDWNRFRRRGVSVDIYMPRKKDQFVRWLALLDTSGSMSRDDMTYGVSQLRCLDGRSEGLVVCCDAQTYWDQATNIRSMSDLPKINPVGRGGTCFFSYFEDYRKYMGDEFDLMIIMTDGGIFDLEKLKRPHCDCVWVITNNYEFKPPFGRVAPMRRF